MQGEPLSLATPLREFARLASEAQALLPEAVVDWQASAELREQGNAAACVWLHLQAKAAVPLTCQRCMQAVFMPLQIDQWYRFVESEEVAMAEDDEAEEDLLVMVPQFDLLALLEDELLMALPLVPMHELCPQPLVDVAVAPMEQQLEKPNPFAVLAQLKKR